MFFDSQNSSTIIEAIAATRRTIAPYIILAGKRRMQNWFNSELLPTTVLDMSDKGFTNWCAVVETFYLRNKQWPNSS